MYGSAGISFFSKAGMEYFHAGYLGVEFFFIVSGFFIGMYYEKHLDHKNLKERFTLSGKYVWGRFKRLYPFYFMALILMLIVRTYLNHYSLEKIVSVVKSCLAEFVLLQWTPLGNEVLNSSDWFVPAVFWGSVFFILVLALTKKAGGFIIAPLISLLLYGYYFRLIGKIDVIVYYHCILRGMAGIGLGVFISFIYTYMEEKSSLLKEETKKRLASFIEIPAGLLFVGIFVYTNFGHRSKLDFLIIVLYAFGILMLMLGNLRLPEKAEKLFLMLGKSTYAIYMFQMPLIELVLQIRY